MGCPTGELTDETLRRLGEAFSQAFAPLLDPTAIRKCLDRELHEFLGSESLFVRQYEYEQLDIPNELWAIRCWTSGAADPTGQTAAKATILPIRELEFVRRPFYTDVEVAPGKTLPCLSSGRILLERSGRRCAIEVRERTRTLYEELIVDLMVAEGSPDSDAIAADFEEALRRHDPTRGAHLTFDKAGLGFLQPPGVTWDDVVLPETIKEELRRNVTLFLRAHQNGLRATLPPSRSLCCQGRQAPGRRWSGRRSPASSEESRSSG